MHNVPRRGRFSSMLVTHLYASGDRLAALGERQRSGSEVLRVKKISTGPPMSVAQPLNWGLKQAKHTWNYARGYLSHRGSASRMKPDRAKSSDVKEQGCTHPTTQLELPSCTKLDSTLGECRNAGPIQRARSAGPACLPSLVATLLPGQRRDLSVHPSHSPMEHSIPPRIDTI
jgi:hypothetical protein